MARFSIRRFLPRGRRDLDAEIRAHLTMAEEDARGRGASPSDARADARRTFGNVLHVAEAARAVTGWPAADSLGQDVSRAVRRILRAPRSSGAALAMVAVAVGVTTAMFSLLDSLVLRPLPFPDADRLAEVRLWHGVGGGGTIAPTSQAAFQALRGASVFEDVEAYSRTTAVIGDENPRMGDVASVTPGLLTMLGAHPILGRTLAAADANDAGNPPVVIAERVWRERYA